MKCLQQLCSLVLLIGMTQFAFAQDLSITSPASIAGDYPSIQAAFGVFSDGEAASLVLIDDGLGVSNGCDPAFNVLTGAIAVIDRGACGFTQKVANAEAAGAIAVVICNNDTAAPDDAIVMGGNDGCLSTIPAIMISYNSCVTIKTELGAGVMGTMPSSVPAVGDAVGNPIVLPAPGMYTADTLVGTGSELTDAVAAKIYTITPPVDVAMNVNACAGGADTRLTIVQGCRNVLTVAGANDDACEIVPGGTDLWASDLSIVAYGGQEYILHWDDRWDASGFDFEISYASLSMTDVVFTVDMSQEVVDDLNPPMIAGSMNSWTQEALTDNGDGTWSGTYSILAGDAIQYKFLNGTDGWEPSADLESCGADDGVGGFNRAYTVNLNPTQTLSNVCFASCAVCPPPACTDPNAIICDDFEMYSLSDVSGQSAHWTPWGGTPGAGDDATVSDAFAFGGTQSLLVSEANGDDMLLLLGDVTTGHYLLEWKMYVPSGSTGYFNTQKDEVPATEFGMQVEFFADGTSTLDAGAADVVTTNWTADTWMDISLRIDLTNDWMTYILDGAEVYSWPASWTTFTETGMLQLGAINFFGNAGTVQYIDDVLFKALPECPDDAIICDSYEGYVSGTFTGGQAPWWTTWSGTPGGDEDGIVSSDQVFDGDNSMLIGNNGIQDVLLLLGNQTSGNWSIQMQMYVPTGSVGYFNIQEDEAPGVQWNMEAWFNANNGSVYTPGMGMLASGETYATPQDAWFPVVNNIDLDNGTHTLIVNGVTVLDDVAYAGAQIGGLDFFSISAENTAYFDAIRYVQLEPIVVPPSPVPVTFNVDMSQVVDAMPAFIAGEMNGWAGAAMTDNLDMTYSTTLDLLPGDTVEYKFQNGLDGWEEGIPDDCTLGGFGNRYVVVGDVAMDIGIVCFQECEACVPIAVDEKSFAAGLSMFPNPTTNTTTVTYNFNESMNLDITLSNTIGQQLSRTSLKGVQSGTHSIDLNNITPGIYLVQITDGKNNLTKRLVVQ